MDHFFVKTYGFLDPFFEAGAPGTLKTGPWPGPMIFGPPSTPRKKEKEIKEKGKTHQKTGVWGDLDSFTILNLSGET